MASARSSLLAIYNPAAQTINVNGTPTSESAVAFTGTVTAGTPDDVKGNLMTAVQALNGVTALLQRVAAVVDGTTATAIGAILATL